MPKFIVNMNFVEAKSTNFIIEADSEDDVYDGLDNMDYTFFEKNCKWLSSGYEPPVIDNVEQLQGKLPNKTICTKEQNKKIQIKFTKVIESFNKAESDSDE